MTRPLTADDIMFPGTLFYHVFHGSPVGMVILNADNGDFIEINDAFARLIGYSRDELIGRPFTTVGLNLDMDRETILEQLRTTPSLADIPVALTSRDGQAHTGIASIQLEKVDGRGYFFAMVQDVTAQEQISRALQYSESRFRFFLRSIPLPLLVIDEQTTAIIDVNPAACAVYGYTPDEFASLAFNDLFPTGRPQPKLRGSGVSHVDDSRPVITNQLLKDGRTIEVSLNSFSLEIDGRYVSLVIVEDVTDQRALQAELEAGEERLRIIADMTADAMWDYDMLTGKLTFSSGFSAMFGIGNADDMIPDWWKSRIHPDDRQAVDDSISDALASHENFWSAEYRLQRRDGVYANVLNNGYITRDSTGRPVGFMGSLIDLTRPLELADVAARAALEERQRLAHNLHDSVTQSLYSVSLLAEATHRRAESGDEDALIGNFDRLCELTVQVLRQMRLLVYELRPDALEQEGLAGALRHRLEAVEHRAGVKSVLTDDTRGPIPPRLQGDLFWIAQEALNNALRHAAATAVAVHLFADDAEIVMEISDDGRGFDNVWRDDAGGLIAIRRRVTDMGGELSVNSHPGEGTSLSVRVPRGDDRHSFPLIRDPSAGMVSHRLG